MALCNLLTSQTRTDESRLYTETFTTVDKIYLTDFKTEDIPLNKTIKRKVKQEYENTTAFSVSVDGGHPNTDQYIQHGIQFQSLSLM